MPSKFGVRGIIFFDDYSLYARCKLESMSRSVKITDIIAECCEKYINSKSNESKVYKNTEMLFVDCKKYATLENKSVAKFIEDACALELVGKEVEVSVPAVEEKKKGSWLDLNRDAKK